MIAKEITKLHERFYRENIDEIESFEEQLKGEITVVISEIKSKTKFYDKQKIINKAKIFLKKYSLKDTVDLLIKTENINKRTIYQLCLKAKNEKNI